MNWVREIKELAIEPSILNWYQNIKHVTKAFSLKASDIRISHRHEFEAKMDSDTQECLNEPNPNAWFREVVISSNEIPWCYALAVFPWETYQNNIKALSMLGNSPLGDNFLYKTPSFERQDFEFSTIEPGTYFYKRLSKLINMPASDSAPLMRRSIFTRNNESVLLHEVFMNTIFDDSHAKFN